MNSQKVKIGDVKINPNNPRIIKDDKFKKLVQSVKDFPEMLEIRPIVVNADMVVLGGNMRLKACKEAGIKEVPIIIADNLTEEQQREFLIKDNVGFGEWNWEELQADWDVEQLGEWGLDMPKWAEGLDVNSMTDEDVDLEEEFDPIGISNGLTRIVIIHDNLELAKKWIDTNIPNLDYKKKGNDENIILQVNLSSNYGI